MDSPTVGVVGLENIGGRVARVLLSAFPVCVFDIDDAVARLVKARATPA